MSRGALFALLLGCACAAQRVEANRADPASLIAGGQVLNVNGVKAIIGAPVQVEISFKDNSPPCLMAGAVQLARDSAHRWVWLEPQAGCPEWLVGRWWAELATGANGWYLQNISTQPVNGAQR